MALTGDMERVTRAWYPAILGFVVDWYQPPADFSMGFSYWVPSGP